MVFSCRGMIYISMNTGIYRIRNIINGKCYIGSTSWGFTSRWNSHIRLLRKNKHNNQHLQHSWNKYGEQNFTFDIIEYCNKSDCIIREQFYIDTLHPEYNILSTAYSMLGYNHTAKSKALIGAASAGKNHPQYSGEHMFYNPKFGLFTGNMLEFSNKYSLRKSISYKLKDGILYKSHGWVYVGKSTEPIPPNIEEFYYNRKHNNRPKYSFYHIDKGIFTGTIPDFIYSNNISRRSSTTIHELVNRSRKMAWGWIFLCVGSEIPPNITELYNIALSTNTNARKRTHIIYTFSHPTVGKYDGTKHMFCDYFNLNYQCVNHLESGKLKSYRGWIMKNLDLQTNV